MGQQDYLDVFVLAERLHLQFLEAIRLELERLRIRDINDVRALMLLNIGESELTAGELLWTGAYLGSNVSYNLKKLTETGYVVQTRSQHDRRVVMVRNSEKGRALCDRLKEMNERHIAVLNQANCLDEELTASRRTLRAFHNFLCGLGDMIPGQSAVTGSRRPATLQPA